MEKNNKINLERLTFLDNKKRYRVLLNNLIRMYIRLNYINENLTLLDDESKNKQFNNNIIEFNDFINKIEMILQDKNFDNIELLSIITQYSKDNNISFGLMKRNYDYEKIEIESITSEEFNINVSNKSSDIFINEKKKYKTIIEPNETDEKIKDFYDNSLKHLEKHDE